MQPRNQQTQRVAIPIEQNDMSSILPPLPEVEVQTAPPRLPGEQSAGSGSHPDRALSSFSFNRWRITARSIAAEAELPQHADDDNRRDEMEPLRVPRAIALGLLIAVPFWAMFVAAVWLWL